MLLTPEQIAKIRKKEAGNALALDYVGNLLCWLPSARCRSSAIALMPPFFEQQKSVA